MQAGRLNRRVTILQLARGIDENGADVSEYVEFATIWADVRDITGRELRDSGVNIATRPCRVRARFRDDIDSTMRLSIAGRDGEWRITSQPAEIGNREGIEFTAEQVTTEGDEP